LNRVKITVQFSSTATGEQLWSQRFVRELTAAHLFDIQDEIIRSIVAKIGDGYGILLRALSKTTDRKRVEELSFYEAILWMYRYERTLTPETYRQALEALQHAVELDPEYALIWGMFAVIYADSRTLALDEIDNPVGQAERYARPALLLDPRCQFCHYGMVEVYDLQMS
jgi:hypothetical protein